MTRRRSQFSVVGAWAGTALILLATASCAGTKGQDRLANVDDLVEQIERVHVDSELAQSTTRNAIESLRRLVARDYGPNANAVDTYESFVQAIALSEERAGVLEQSVTRMKFAAQPVFERWKRDLNVFVSPQLRERSQKRFNATQDRYNAIVAAADPAVIASRNFHTGLRDHAIFLGHDFNADAVAEIAGDFEQLDQSAMELDDQLRECMLASQAYFETRALPSVLEDPRRRAARPPASR